MAYQTVNPANNQLIKVSPHTDADIEAALQKLTRSITPTGRGEIDQRLPVLHKLADLIDSRVEELAKIASQRWASSSSKAVAKSNYARRSLAIMRITRSSFLPRCLIKPSLATRG